MGQSAAGRDANGPCVPTGILARKASKVTLRHYPLGAVAVLVVLDFGGVGGRLRQQGYRAWLAHRSCRAAAARAGEGFLRDDDRGSGAKSAFSNDPSPRWPARRRNRQARGRCGYRWRRTLSAYRGAGGAAATDRLWRLHQRVRRAAPPIYRVEGAAVLADWGACRTGGISYRFRELIFARPCDRFQIRYRSYQFAPWQSHQTTQRTRRVIDNPQRLC